MTTRAVIEFEEDYISNEEYDKILEKLLALRSEINTWHKNMLCRIDLENYTHLNESGP